MARVRQYGQGIDSDTPFELRQWIVADWRHRKAIRWRVFRSEAEALEAAGLRDRAA